MMKVKTTYKIPLQFPLGMKKSLLSSYWCFIGNLTSRKNKIK